MELKTVQKRSKNDKKQKSYNLFFVHIKMFLVLRKTLFTPLQNWIISLYLFIDMGINHHHRSTIGDLQILVNNENLGVSNENMVSPTKIWGLQCKSEGLLWNSGGLQRKYGGTQRKYRGLQRESRGFQREYGGLLRESGGLQQDVHGCL